MEEIQAVLNEILDNQYRLQNELAAMFILLVIFMLGIVMYLREFKDRHTIQNLSRGVYQQVTVQAKKAVRKLKNLGGGETTPDVSVELERAFAALWLEQFRKQESYKKDGAMRFTEKEWMDAFRSINGSREDWVRLMARFKEARIVKQYIEGASSGKGTALIAARGEIGMIRKMEKIAGVKN